ncbi:pre-mRNA processing RNA-helicase [Friedmanniomyces endolithicus]|uniref:RNA helicase n=1 Tax=Friedmanniomyces endolithicus TaxID=329885 RepID=A0AAN6FE18_9PEZI|nr:pre-mRNA processing RNA-helicase [Friedmanniomyces endolithicus]KAK0279877.1 pre-mRNA processing RNA-helicase [Friedmanniomyces endolithicus]KAK0305371.1 pre-mRNA processing RNA-helicase [Friedmanniomyces endolithicus]KAK0311017.1 pre-mRNA processing RNA-helicase [Friedmanniomyces endolithicus]KAK0835614.1 pre-mRNA processing RNA-helicase [Friedmanniomyces endolithicus]
MKSSSVKGNEVRLFSNNTSRILLIEQSPRPTGADDAAEETKRAKLAKVEAWKKQLAEKNKLGTAKASGPASPGGNLGNSTGPGSPALQFPAITSPVNLVPSSPIIKDKKPASPAPYAGKFDPKAIAKRAAAKLEKSRAALDGNAVIPKSATEASVKTTASLANNSKVASASSWKGAVNHVSNNAKISGFGLSKAGAEKSLDKPSSANKPAANLGEDEEISRRLEKLPDLSDVVATGDTALANGADEQDEGVGDIHSDEEDAEAAREAAQKRAQAEQNDVAMADGGDTAVRSTDVSGDVEMADEDEVDPLDAFMNDLTVPADNDMPNLAIGKSEKKGAQVFNSDDEGDLDAVGNGTDDIMAMAAKRKRKDIPVVNHAKMQYEPFRKAFYTEPIELAEMTAEDLDILRSDMDNITVRGKDTPKPIFKWSQGSFGAQISDVLSEMGYEKPTPIQSQTLPAIMSGRDTIGIAKTGSGKTVAYLLPMFRHIKDQPPLEKLDGPIGLILAPTRELATQIHRDCKPYLKALNLRAVCAYGGAPIKDQIAELKRGAEVVVATPGRIIDLLAANSGRVTNLKRVTYIVLDEADRMYDMGFEPQISKILGNIRPDRQTVCFSATFPPKLESLARKALTRPLEILVGGRSVVAAEITQIIEVRTEDTKSHRMLQLLGELHDVDEDARSLIFVERQETADKLLMFVNKKGYPGVSIHGGREQNDRDQAIADFKNGASPVMVATSVAARGLDVKQLKLVINYDSPNHKEDYVHRVGRTGRAGNTGTAVTFVTPEQDRFAQFLIGTLKDSKQAIPEELQKLHDAHEEKVKVGAAQNTSSGFGGRGIERLNVARDAERARERRVHKTGDEGEEEEEEVKDEKTDKKQSEIDKMVAKAAGQVKDRDAKPEETIGEERGLPSALVNHLDKAMKVEKRVTPPPTSAGPKSNDPLAKVNAAAASINSRLGARGAARPGVPIDNRGPDAGLFHATLEINDFPQKARWAVTNRTNVAKILDSSGTSITSKGVFYDKGKEPGTGEQPKLYILVEGDTEVAVQSAMSDLTRLLKEGALAAMEADNKAPVGRYSVV